MIDPILEPDEPSPVTVHRPDGRSPLFLACDHAGRRVPRRLGRLGLDEAAFERHIAWDIGIAAVSRRLSDALDGTLIEQAYSRLVVDCNRPPGVPTSIPEISEATPIPGNIDLEPADRQARLAAIFRPYHDAITTALDARERDGRPTALIAMHSFTPVFLGTSRPWHVGTLYGRDARLARALHRQLVAEGDLVVGDNEPYAVTDGSDYAIPVHGERRGLAHVGIEVRQDLITDEEGQAAWAARLARLLPLALSEVAENDHG